MQVLTHPPQLAVAFVLDRYAPRAARHYVAQVDRPSPDLRDAVLLIVSDLVSGAVDEAPGATLDLRVWMPSEVVRVELEGPREAVRHAPRHPQNYASLLLDEIADRWELVEVEGARALLWFEIDRHP
jgi:hypothetical protein